MPPTGSSRAGGCDEKEGLSDRVKFVLGDATETGLPDGSADFVWGEDAWCYVGDKGRLIAEAARIVRSGGQVVFGDWLAGPEPISGEEAERFLRFMKFPNVLDLDDYRTLLQESGCQVETAEDTGRFPSHVDLYLNMLNMQLTYDALKDQFRHGTDAGAGRGDELHSSSACSCGTRARLTSGTVCTPARCFTSTEARSGLIFASGTADDDGRAVEAVADGFADLGCTPGQRGRCIHYLRRLVTARGV